MCRSNCKLQFRRRNIVGAFLVMQPSECIVAFRRTGIEADGFPKLVFGEILFNVPVDNAKFAMP